MSEETLAALDPVPITLLPVRLETRYIGPPDGPTELRIRVYPDQVHVDAHQPALTDGEVAAAQAYWRHRWGEGSGADERQAAAWVELTRGVRATRAAHLVRMLTPTNAPPADPVFPDVSRRDATIDQPLALRALPERWAVVAWDGAGQQVLRKWFDHPVAPGLLASAETTDGAPLPVDEAVDRYLGWTANFDQAVQVGMAVTVSPADVGGSLAGELSRVVVVGVRPGDGRDELVSLLADHAVTDGLAFLPPGVATNNIDEAAATSAAGTSAAGTPALVAPTAVPDPTLPPPALDLEWSAGARLAEALGLPLDALAAVPGATDTTAGTASAVVSATWAATLGYFADQLLEPLLDDATLAEARDHARAFLQPLGPIGTLRVGRQPLGVLPVMARGRTPDATGFAPRLARLLDSLRPVWDGAVGRIPTLTSDGATFSGEVEQALLAVLQRAPWTMRVWYRRVFGPLIGLAAGGFGRTQRLQAAVRTIGILDGLGVAEHPRVLPFVVRPEPRALRIPMIGRAGEGGPELGYLELVRSLTATADGRVVLNQAADADSLLEALVTFGALQELDLSAARIGRRVLPEAAAAAWRTPEISGIAGGVSDLDPLTLATTPIAQLGGRTLAEEVHRRQQAGAPGLEDLGEFQSALDSLGRANPVQVELALRAQLGACSHRLDAWCTSLASRQLRVTRKVRGPGLVLGGYGCVDRLHPEAAPDSLGYVTGPSLAHAATAGVMRSGHLANPSVERLDVDLSSARVRTALALIRGVREGVPLSVLLGYRLERALREDDLALFILPLRSEFPLRHPPVDETGPVESTPPQDVVDAADLLDRWPSFRFEPPRFVDRVVSVAGLLFTDPRVTRLMQHFDELADVYDAIADVVLAEAVHQMLSANPERAQAATRFLDRQEVPSEPDVTATPRRSHAFVQRCAVAIGQPRLSLAWRTLTANDPRAMGEPRVNAWVAGLLGEPDAWAFSGRAVAADGTPGPVLAMPLADLGLSPLALLAAAVTGGGDRPTELEQRVGRLLTARLAPGDGVGVELLADAEGALGLAPFTALCGAIARVLRTARPGDARTIALPDSSEPSGVDVVELERRATRAETGMRTVAGQLATILRSAVPRAGPLRAVLDRASRAGLVGAVPPLDLLHEADGDPASADALSFGAAVSAALQRCLEQLAGISAADRETAARRRLATVFGERWPVLGLVSVPADAELTGALGRSGQTALVNRDPLAVATWLTRMSKVRPELDALWHLLVAAEATTGGFDATQWSVVQRPHRPGDRWAALAFEPARRPAQVQVAAAVHTPGRARLSGIVAVMVVDSWTEQIPMETETAGVALHYDAPSNRAPQVALLAVPPDAEVERPWDLDLLVDSVAEALDLARLRGVTTAELPGAGAILPALYLPFDVADRVPSINLDRLADRLGPAQLVLGKD